jgi:transmembrane secretion effector
MEPQPVPLRRNRDFVLLQTGQLLSSFGTQSSIIAYPLLALAVTHSPAKTGAVGFARLIPSALLILVAGVAADRWNRKRLMIAADVTRACAVATLGALIVLDRLEYWQILVVAAVEGTGAVVYGAARPGALNAVVSTRQLPDAANVSEARLAVTQLAGPPLGGALFAIGKAVPFIFDAISYSASMLSLVAISVPFQPPRERRQRMRAEIAEAFSFLWRQPFLRACAFFFTIGDFIGPALFIVLVVVGKDQGLSSGEIGVLVASFGAALLVGSLLSPFLRRLLPARAILVLEAWMWTSPVLFVLHPSVYVLAGALGAIGVAIPVTNSLVVGYGIALTPERLLGRVESVRGNIALALAPLGPLVAGALLSATSSRVTVAIFAALGGVLALGATLSRGIRQAPSAADLDRPATLLT